MVTSVRVTEPFFFGGREYNASAFWPQAAGGASADAQLRNLRAVAGPLARGGQ